MDHETNWRKWIIIQHQQILPASFRLQTARGDHQGNLARNHQTARMVPPLISLQPYSFWLHLSRYSSCMPRISLFGLAYWRLLSSYQWILLSLTLASRHWNERNHERKQGRTGRNKTRLILKKNNGLDFFSPFFCPTITAVFLIPLRKKTSKYGEQEYFKGCKNLHGRKKVCDNQVNRSNENFTLFWYQPVENQPNLLIFKWLK